MRNRTAWLMVVMSLCLGITFAYAQRPRRAARAGRPAPKVARPIDQRPPEVPPGADWVVVPGPPGIPTGEETLAEARREFLNLEYEGTKIKIHEQVQGEARAFQEGVAEAYRALDALDFVPPQRTAHFAWLWENPDFRHRGWTGHVIAAAPVKGGHQITVRFFPVVDSMTAGKRVVSGESILETYFYDGRALNYLGSSPDPAATQVMLLD